MAPEPRRLGISQSLVAPRGRSLFFAHEPRRPPVPLRGAGARRLGVGEGRRSRPAQGASPLRRRPRRRRLGQAHPHDARRHRRHPARHARPWSPTCPSRCVRRPAATAGTCAPCSPTPTPQASHDAALTDLENGVTSLWIQVGDSGVARRRPRHRARRRAPRRRARGARRPLGPPRRGRARSPRSPRAPTSLPPPTSGSTRSGLPALRNNCANAGRFRRTAARAVIRQHCWGGTVADAAALARSSGAGRWSWTAPRCTTSAPPTCRSSATSWPLGAHYLRELEAAGVVGRRRRRPGRVPAGGHRRAVRDDRQAARRTPALGADARAQRRRRRTTARWCCTR